MRAFQLLVVPVTFLVFVPEALAAGAQFRTHPVKSVPKPGRIVVEYAGMPVTVRLAHLALPESAEAQARLVAELEKLVGGARGKRIRVAYCPEAGLDPDGLPQVYAIAGIKNVNEELVRMGLARYDTGRESSKYYHQKMVSADAAARKAKVGVWAAPSPRVQSQPLASAPSRPGARRGGRRVSLGPPGMRTLAPGFYSELSSSMYHLPTCRWARQMSAQRRIRYKTAGAAERAGKGPCWICLAERAQRAMQASMGPKPGGVRVLAAGGPIVGHAGRFHAPNCEEILEKAAECTSFKKIQEARAAGLTPCNHCLRLSGGPIPLPQKGECAGRAPPHRRPCRRAPSGDSGLCSYCQGKGE